MAITITKPGNKLDDQEYEFKCIHCHREFTAQRRDGCEQSDGLNGEFLMVYCPTCKSPCYMEL